MFGNPEDVIFQKEVLPFLAKNCFGCHGNGESKADLSLDKYKDDLSLIKDRKVWDNVVNILEKHEMPPKENPQLSTEEIERVVKAIDSILSNLDCGKPGSEPNAGRVNDASSQPVPATVSTLFGRTNISRPCCKRAFQTWRCISTETVTTQVRMVHPVD